MIAQSRLLKLLFSKQLASSTTKFCFSSNQAQEKLFNFTSEHIITQDQVGKNEKYQELCQKFEREWKILQSESEDKQKQALNAELTPDQSKKVEILTDSLLQLNLHESRYLNSILKDKVIKSTGLSPAQINTDWPSLKQLENGSWPPANPNWALQQEAIAKLWPSGQQGISYLFGNSVSGGAGGSGGSSTRSDIPATEAAPAAEKAPEAPKEKQNYDIELSGIDAAAKIKIIKEVRSLFNLGLKEAKDLVEKTPCILKQQCKKSEAEELQTKLTALGCTINLI